jgi:hypothetical protein
VVDSASNRNKYQEYFLGGKGGWCIGLTNLPPSCADCLGSLNLLEPSGPVKACNGIALPIYIYICIYSRAPVYTDSVSAVYRGSKKKLERWRNKLFVNFKTPAKRERAVTWWNLAAKTRPVLDSPSFAPVPTLPLATCPHSASTVHAVRISCRVIALFVLKKPLSIN